jgi:hypothetical protein
VAVGENGVKAGPVKYWIYANVPDGLIMCDNCFSAIKKVLGGMARSSRSVAKKLED